MPQPMDPGLLNLLRCPVSRQPLRLVAGAEALRFGLEERDVLLREDGCVYYIFDDHGFPLLLPDAGRTMPGSAGPVALQPDGGSRAD